ncbi:hypothetical protein GCM10022297_16940 [Lactobacillus hamsteri]
MSPLILIVYNIHSIYDIFYILPLNILNIITFIPIFKNEYLYRKEKANENNSRLLHNRY